MGNKIQRIMMRPNGVEKQVRPSGGGGWQPGANTLFYYKFEQNLNDSSGNNRTATGSNIGYTQVNGQYVVTNTSTSNSYVNSPVISGSGISDFAISFWLYPINPGTNRFPLIFAQSEGSSPYKGPSIFYGPDIYSSSWSTNSLMFRLSVSNEQHTGAISLNTWHHVVFTRSSGTCKAYVDGSNVLTWTDTTTWGTPAQGYVFNSNNDNSKQGWGNTGAKADDYIYEKVARTAQEISDYYNSTKAKYGL